MDFAAARAASRRQLGECAIAAAGNAQDLVADAELLAGAGRSARAYSVAALAVEECGKALSLCALANMPEALKAQAPVGGMLEWHGLKLVGGLLLALVPFDSLAPRVADMSSDELAEVLAALDEPADEADRLKRRGMYVDLDGQGRIRRPSEITGAEVGRQLGRARQAAASVSVLLAPDARERLASPPPPEGVELLGDLVGALRAAGTARTPPAAAGVITRAVSRYRERKSGRARPDWWQRPDQRFLPRGGEATHLGAVMRLGTEAGYLRALVCPRRSRTPTYGPGPLSWASLRRHTRAHNVGQCGSMWSATCTAGPTHSDVPAMALTR